MKRILLSLVSIPFALTTATLPAAENICDTQLFKQLLAAEKSNIRRPLIQPTGSLARIMDEDELLCPLQVEKDFNGDKQLDWFGVIEQDKKFYLVSYLSGKTQHKLTKIKQYQNIPANLYFDAASKRTLKQLAGLAPMKYGVNFAAIENKIGGKSSAYAWDGKKMLKVIEFAFTSEEDEE